MNSERVLSCSPEVLFQEVAGELVLLDMRSETYFGLNEVGARVWHLLNQGMTINEIVDALQQEFDVSSDILAADVRELLQQLSAAGLLQE